MKFEALVAVFGVTSTSAFLLGMNPKSPETNGIDRPNTSLNGGSGESKETPIEYPEEKMIFVEVS